MTTSLDPERTAQVRSAVTWAVAVAALHFALGTRTHAVHGLHIALAGLFLVPVVIAAVALERRGGLTAAAVVSGLYVLHLLVNWRFSRMANADQYAWPVVYIIVGLTVGQTVHTANYRKWQRDEVIRRSQRSEMVQGLTGLLTAVGVRDSATLAHSRRVASLAVKIGEQLGMDRDTLVDLRLAGLVHDIGKAGVPDDVLFKNGRLSEEQTVLMRSHVDLAVSMLRAIPGSDSIARVVAQHHECPNGSGYPRGLKGGEIDRAANVLRVADMYAALTERRPYREPMLPSTAISMMFGVSGSQIDAESYGALCEVIERAGGRLVLDGDLTAATPREGAR